MVKLQEINPKYCCTKEYKEIHEYMRHKIVQPSTCPSCGKPKKLYLSNIDHRYSLNPSDWVYLCGSCHKKKDRKNKKLIEVSRMVKLQEMNKRFSIAIPKEKIARLGWQKGDRLDWDFNEHGFLELKKVEKIE